VRRVGQCRGLLTKHERLLRLERATAERKVELPEEQTTRFSREFRERHLEAPHTGSLLAVGTFFVGTLKGVGKFLPADRDRSAARAKPGRGSTPTRCRSLPCTCTAERPGINTHQAQWNVLDDT